MEIEKARQLLENTEQEYLEKNTIRRGLQILEKYVDDVKCEFDHDVIWTSNFEEIIEKMSEQDIVEMAKLGWHEDEENDSWTHF